jgi:hypothetical protein
MHLGLWSRTLKRDRRPDRRGKRDHRVNPSLAHHPRVRSDLAHPEDWAPVSDETFERLWQAILKVWDKSTIYDDL